MVVLIRFCDSLRGFTISLSVISIEILSSKFPLIDVVQKIMSAAGGRRDVFLFNFSTATKIRIDGLRGISLRAGVPCSWVPSKRPAVAKYREAGRRKHGTTMTRRTPRKGRLRPGKPQLIQSAAVSTCCQFWFTERASLWSGHTCR